VPTLLTDAAAWLALREDLILPLVLVLWIAWGDVKTRRIPNYLTLGTAVTGLAYNFAFHGWAGLQSGSLGILLGFGLLIIFYYWGGVGAGDVKALAALGAWLGPPLTLAFFCYMGVAGGILTLGFLCWKGMLRQQTRQIWAGLLNRVLCRPHALQVPAAPPPVAEGIPYGVAMALGMVVLVSLGAD